MPLPAPPFKADRLIIIDTSRIIASGATLQNTPSRRVDRRTLDVDHRENIVRF